ncbi:MAG TPA: OmpA family protein [Blastocatellia bacterium]|nr:OmpA family protein [Blastocatellia bacterium]
MTEDVTEAATQTPADAAAQQADSQPQSARTTEQSLPAQHGATDKLAELRRLLFGGEQDLLQRLQQRLEDPKSQAEVVSRVLPGAIRLRSTRDKQLSLALAPTVEDSITTSVRKNPKRLSDALYPIIGPMIRAAVAHTITSMVQSLNETLNRGFSLQGFKWRSEAWRTGKPFAEVVLLHTLLYRVEQVFLIHKETGLLLMQATAPAVAAQDPQLVSSMLTAIQDFVRDSFSVSQGETLDRLTVGNLNVWVVAGPHAVLAASIRGEAPAELRPLFEEVLEKIHLEHAADLQNFNGDPAVFEASRPELERCLQSQLAGVQDAQPRQRISPALVTAVVVLLFALSTWMFFTIRDNRRWDDYLSRLRAEPGIVVVRAEKSGGSYFVSGLRDPLSADPAEILKSTPLDPARVVGAWAPYQALTPKFIEARAKTLLEPPDSVSLKFENGILSASGIAPQSWAEEARRLARALPGVTQFQSSLSDLQAARERIEKWRVDFPTGIAELTPDQKIRVDELAEEIRRAVAAAQNHDQRWQIEITGHADKTGSDEINQRLRPGRAEAVRAALAARHIDPARLVVTGEKQGVTPLRGVTFKVASAR